MGFVGYLSMHPCSESSSRLAVEAKQFQSGFQAERAMMGMSWLKSQLAAVSSGQYTQHKLMLSFFMLRWQCKFCMCREKPAPCRSFHVQSFAGQGLDPSSTSKHTAQHLQASSSMWSLAGTSTSLPQGPILHHVQGTTLQHLAPPPSWLQSCTALASHLSTTLPASGKPVSAPPSIGWTEPHEADGKAATNPISTARLSHFNSLCQ